MSLSAVAVYFALGWQSSVEVLSCVLVSGRVSGVEATGVFSGLRLRDVTTVHSTIFASYSWKFYVRNSILRAEQVIFVCERVNMLCWQWLTFCWGFLHFIFPVW